MYSTFEHYIFFNKNLFSFLVVPIVLEALLFDERRGSYSVGKHIVFVYFHWLKKSEI